MKTLLRVWVLLSLLGTSIALSPPENPDMDRIVGVWQAYSSRDGFFRLDLRRDRSGYFSHTPLSARARPAVHSLSWTNTLQILMFEAKAADSESTRYPLKSIKGEFNGDAIQLELSFRGDTSRLVPTEIELISEKIFKREAAAAERAISRAKRK